MIRKHLPLFAAAWLPLVLAASVASAATSISNSLKGFTGDSTQAATQAAVAAAGLEFDTTAGTVEDPPGSGLFIDPTITFDADGAHFGDFLFGNGGRNYMRTIAGDYANHSFVAEITMDAPNINTNDGYFGMGAGHAFPFRTPDWQTEFTSVMYWGESEIANPSVDTFTIRNGDGPFVTTPTPLLTDGTHRIRMTYDWFEKTAKFSFDFNFAGGAFVTDFTAPTIDTLFLYAADSWPGEPAKIFFGGGSSVVFKDLQVNVTSPSTVLGDFTADGSITSADWGVLRSNQLGNFSGDTAMQAYFKGDLNVDKRNNVADFVIFKQLYDAANGVGSFEIMAASVPEPSTACLIVSVGVLAAGGVRRSQTRR